MAQAKAYQPLTKAMSDARDDYIEFERGFDRILSDTVLKGTQDKCNELLETDDGSIFNFGGLSEKTVIDAVKKAGNALTDGVENLLGEDFFNSAGSAIDGFTQFICVTVNGALKVITELLETTLSIPILLIDKLLQLLDKLINTLNQLTLILMECLLDKVNQVKNFINNLIPRPGNLEGLSLAIDSCPQLYCFIVDFFKPICKGATFSNTQGLLECLRDKLTVPLNTLFNDYIIDIIKGLVDDFLNLTERARQFLVKKIRGLIKQYLKALYKKVPIPSGVRWLLTETGSCKGPKKASIVDIINGLRRFSTCIDTLCSAVNSTLKRDIQELNERLRLSFSYWKKFGVGYDLFLMLEREDRRESAGNDARKEVIGKKNSPSENTLTTKSVVEAASQDLSSPLNPTTNVDSIIANSYAEEKQSLIDADVILSNGERLFREGVEDELVKIYQNLSQEIYIYEDKYNEFSDWDAEYFKDKLNEEKKKIIEDIESAEEPAPITGQAQFLSTDSKKYVPYIRVTQSAFSAKNDAYKPLSNTPAPKRTSSQSSLEYYSKWYNLLTG